MIDVSPKPPAAPVYLGDGVYASYDGYHIELRLSDAKSPPVIYLDPTVMKMLNIYYDRVVGR